MTIKSMTEAEAWRVGNLVFLGAQPRLINNARAVALRRCIRHEENGTAVIIKRKGKYIPAMIVPKQIPSTIENLPA